MELVTRLVLLLVTICGDVVSQNETTARTRLFDVITGFARTSRDVIVGQLGKLQYPDDAAVARLVQELAPNFRQPQPRFDLPAMDPYTSSRAQLLIDSDEVGLIEANFTNMVVHHMSAYTVNKMNIRWIRRELHFDVGFPQITAYANYELDGKVGRVFPVFGRGPMVLNVFNLNITGYAKLGSMNKFLYVQNVNLTYTVQQVQSDLSNLMGGGKLGFVMNSVLSEDGVTALELVRPSFSGYLSRRCKEIFNDLLAEVHITLTDVLRWVNVVGVSQIKAILDLAPFRTKEEL